MLHTKSQGHWPSGSGEEVFKGLTIYGRGGHPGHMTKTIWINFRSPILYNTCMCSIGPVVSEEKMFENVDGRRTDGRTDAVVIGILLAHQWAFGSGEL